MILFDRKRARKKILTMPLVLLVEVGIILAAFLIALGCVGCDKPYLPWNAGPSWSSAGSEQPRQVEPQQVIQRDLENFCEDNRESVEIYRRFLEPDFDWNTTPSAEERRRRYMEQFIRQYDAECN